MIKLKLVHSTHVTHIHIQTAAGTGKINHIPARIDIENVTLQVT